MADFGESFAAGFGLMSRTKDRKREREYQDELRARQREQWGREDAATAQLQQLAYDQQYGQAVPGTDNSNDIAEAARLGMPRPESTLQRTPVSDAAAEERLGKIALGLGDVRGYRESRANRKALKKEEDAKNFGARMSAFLRGDDTVFADDIRQGNLDGGVRGTLGLMPDGSYAYTDPQLGQVVPLSRAETGRLLQQAWAFGQGDLMQGFKAMSEQEAAEHQKRTEAENKRRYEAEFGLKERQLANQEQQTKNLGDYYRGSLNVQRARLGRENAALRKMDEGQKLAEEAGGYAQGVVAARGAGAKEAEQIYAQRLAGMNARLGAMGIRGYEPFTREKPVDPLLRSQLARNYAAMGMDPEDALREADMQLSSGVDINIILNGLRELDAKKGAKRPDKVTNPQDAAMVERLRSLSPYFMPPPAPATQDEIGMTRRAGSRPSERKQQGFPGLSR